MEVDGLFVNFLSYSVWLYLTKAMVSGEVLRRRTGLMSSLFNCDLWLKALFFAHHTPLCFTATRWRVFLGMKCSASLLEMRFRCLSVIFVKAWMRSASKI